MAVRRVVLDLDETVLRRSPLGRLAVYVPGLWRVPGAVGLCGEPLLGALETVRRLRDNGVLVHAVTARWGALGRGNTRAWLDAFGMQDATLSIPDWPLPDGDARAAWKTRAIAELARGPEPILAGVGDRASDIRAYRKAGLPLAIGVTQLAALGPAGCPARAASMRSAGADMVLSDVSGAEGEVPSVWGAVGDAVLRNDRS